ncbi:hypothetical protein GCM10009546_66760 [Actinomadura livida]|uniref:Uncharacterized protein n=1 Tax=Actinomadura livida TaxID=79909 RepID=A0ABN1FPT1_9ACTN|nr:hypothetical protein GCM10010208_40090 [Actinomadura livida]
MDPLDQRDVVLERAVVRQRGEVLHDHVVGTGMLPVRRGPATAPRALLSPLGLAWRLPACGSSAAATWP